MADVNPLKLVDLGDGQGQLREMQAGDKIPGGLLPATEWAADTVSQPEAEAGASEARRAWTAERVRQAIQGWWNGATSAFGRGFVAAADAAAGRTALGLGTAATAAQQTSLTDATVGRLQRVGAFGWGTADIGAPTSDDLDTYLINGLYLVGGSSANAPMNSTGGLMVTGADGGSGRLQQTWHAVSSSRIFNRYRFNGAFGPWVEMYHTGNLVPNVLATFTLATLPSAAANPRLQVYCSDLAGQAAPVFSDGTNWRRVSDNTIAN